MRRALCFVSSAVMLSLMSLAAVASQDRPQGYLGVTVSAGEGGEAGAVINEVVPDGPAAKAGLKTGDRVVKVGEQDVKDVEAFQKAVAAHEPGEKLAFTVVRAGKNETATATLAERPARSALRPDFLILRGDRAPAYLGVQLQPLTPELRKELKAGEGEGVAISEVIANSPAAKAGLRRDDVIAAVDGQPVKSPDDLREQVQRAGPGKELALTVLRGGDKLTVKAIPQAGAFGQFLTPGDERYPFPDVGPMFDASRRIRELERKIAELEERVRGLEGKSERSK
jgi:serine protease Do